MSAFKRALAILASLILIVVMTACNNAEPESTPEPEETISPSPSVTVAAAAPVTPSPTPGITPVPVTPPPEVTVDLTGGFKALAKESDIVVMGRFKKVNGIVNMAPDPNNKMKIDMTLLPTDYKHDGKRAYMGEYQLEFVVEAVYQGSSKVKKNATVLVHLPYEYQMKGMQLNKEEYFLLPELDKPCIMFLSKDSDYDLYAPGIEPHMFYLDNDVLYIATADEAIAATWEKGAGVTGIALEALRKDLGIK